MGSKRMWAAAVMAVATTVGGVACRENVRDEESPRQWEDRAGNSESTNPALSPSADDRELDEGGGAPPAYREGPSGVPGAATGSQATGTTGTTGTTTGTTVGGTMDTTQQDGRMMDTQTGTTPNTGSNVADVRNRRGSAAGMDAGMMTMDAGTRTKGTGTGTMSPGTELPPRR